MIKENLYHTVYCSPGIERAMEKMFNSEHPNSRNEILNLGIKVVVNKSLPRDIIIMMGEGKDNFQIIKIKDMV